MEDYVPSHALNYDTQWKDKHMFAYTILYTFIHNVARFVYTQLG